MSNTYCFPHDSLTLGYRRSLIGVERRHPVRIVNRPYHRLKRGFDILVCLLLLPVAGPIMLVCALLIRLEAGDPVIFRQMRT